MVEPTYGGRLLRILREERNLTQEEVYLESGVAAPKTVSHIESGRSRYPKRETIENLLKFYQANFDESQEVLKAFGYFPEHPLPDTEAIALIMAQMQPVLNAEPVPAYVVDFIARFHGYNELFLKLSGLERHDMAELEGQPLWKAEYDSSEISPDELDDNLLADARRLRRQMRVYVGEPWFESFIEECGQPFLSHWQAVGNVSKEETLPATMSGLKRINFDDAPGAKNMLHFFITEEVIDCDGRFRIIRFMPADGPTWQWVESWAQS